MRYVLPMLLLMLGAAPQEAQAFRLYSYALVNDDGSLNIRNHTVRLFGLSIPPTGRTCITFEQPAVCGSYASLALDLRIGTNFVDCETTDENPDGTLEAICRINGEDLGAWMLAQGWALALPDAPAEYVELEGIARQNGSGMWGWWLGGIPLTPLWPVFPLP